MHEACPSPFLRVFSEVLPPLPFLALPSSTDAMEPRRWRPKFYNPFTERRKLTSYSPVYRGFFRVMPLHRWSLDDIQAVLGYAAVKPSLFGFPDQPTCIVNTAHFLPSHRSRSRGIWVFGVERGCKSIIVPASCNTEPFDALDAKLMEPLFRWNPGVEYIYLSQFCQPMASHLVPYLQRCTQLRILTLEGWNDAAAIHRVVIACKHVNVVDAFSLDDPPREWKNELAVQALNTLIEMHPKLICVKATRLYLADWYEATQYSRCKHNIALVPFSCDFVLLHYGLFLLLLCVPAYFAFRGVWWLLQDTCSQAYLSFWSVIATVVVFVAAIALDMSGWRSRGRGWVHMQKYFILAKRRWDIMMGSHHKSLVML
ncbi:hypothetical protein DQ04_02191020 [Trypanosoma grayi]|uniref:hypothetical protein n=1 Tax=Trypanosoma grayi TaxID=71804 RepID=UPI0004F4254F|nr:hypothetical protein DQ04_02191020 [Trypanosoma grayi]KEG11870.1 hypothetical protein DQ04_02191020 [Trypanosoma grayi]